MMDVVVVVWIPFLAEKARWNCLYVLGLNDLLMIENGRFYLEKLP